MPPTFNVHRVNSFCIFILVHAALSSSCTVVPATFTSLLSQALKHYGSIPGPHQSTADELHVALRDIVIGTVEGQYKATGFLWENYDSVTGKGRGTHPFTGWTALVVLIMADEY